ncbi:MAG: helix-turn-helix transcriptional regulator [Sideroxyarcus sp.]|nr:helix-turn-helix transcriptional regulator [Sideroxyarcus sp.]
MGSPAEASQTLFTRRLKAARRNMGIAQKELGIRAGIDEYCASARINQYERGKHVPDFLTVQNLAKVLKVPTAYFFAEDDKLAELIAAYGVLKAADRKSLLAMANSLSDQSN